MPSDTGWAGGRGQHTGVHEEESQHAVSVASPVPVKADAKMAFGSH